MKRTHSIRSKLILLLITAMILIAVLMGITRYFLVMQNLEAMDLQRRALVEDNILRLMQASDSVYQMAERPIEEKSRAVLSRMVEDYRQKGISGIDLADFYDAESGLDLYIIDSTDTIIAATYEQDIGLNFTQFEGVGEFLYGIRKNGVFYSDRLSLSSLENKVTKYSYFPTPDGLYIFEAGRVINRDQAIPDELSFDNFGDAILKNQGFVLSAELFSRSAVTYNEDVSKIRQVDPAYRQYYDEALAAWQPVTFKSTYKGQSAWVKYLPVSFERANTIHGKAIIEIIYSDTDLQKSRAQLITTTLSIALLGSGLITVIGIIIFNTLVSPLKTLNKGIQRVSLGDYDSRITLKTKDEFSFIAGSFNEMTEKIKTSITDLKQKEQEIAALYGNESSLNEELRQLIELNKQNYFQTIKALANVEEEKDAYTRGHCERVMNYVLGIGRSLNLSEKDMDALRFGAILHDIGKIGVPEQLLSKEAPLSDGETALIRQHVSIGARILGGLAFMKDSIRIISEHHECYDGNGYPAMLKGEDIDLLARIVCVADAFDAMTSQRPYRKTAMTVPEAVRELRKQSGAQFDPKVVEVFISLLEQGGVVPPPPVAETGQTEAQ